MSDWIRDGHKVVVYWDADELHAADVICPFEGATSLCRRQRDYCVVSRFMGVYGAELNIGNKIAVNGPVEIAWVAQLGESDLDNEYAGMWIVPITDPRLADEPESLELE